MSSTLMQQEPSDNQAGKLHSLLFELYKLMNQTWLHTYNPSSLLSFVCSLAKICVPHPPSH